MSMTNIPQVSAKMRKRIKRIVRSHYGFTPKDDDFEWVDDVLRNNYVVLHDQQIIRRLVTVELTRGLLRHRDRIGSLEFERIWLDKTIFNFLTSASMCYRAGIPAGAISLCRTALEAGLRERLAEVLAKKDDVPPSELPEATWSRLKTLKDKTLGYLIQLATKEGLLTKQDIEDLFQGLKFKDQSGRKILDKFIHGDIVWLVDFIKAKEDDTEVIGARDVLQEYKMISDMRTDTIAVYVLGVIYKIAEMLYFDDL